MYLGLSELPKQGGDSPDSAGPSINRALLEITVLEITHGIKKHTVPENGCDFRMSTYDVY